MNCKRLALISVLLLPACAPDPSAVDDVTSQDEAIVGGTAARIQDSPWQVSLFRPGFGNNCGGSILDETHVLTARHCFEAGENNKATLGSPKDVVVVAGVAKLSDMSHAQVVDIDDVVPVVDGYDGNPEHGKDILLVRLARPLHFNSKVQPIQLATRDDERAGLTAPGTRVRATGWGATVDPGAGEPVGSDELRAVDLTLAPASLLQPFEPDGPINVNEIIATTGVAGKDACFGDSGGALVVKKGHEYIQVGIVSFGFQACGSGAPSAFTRVAAFTDAVDRALCEEQKIIKRKSGIAGGVGGPMKFIAIDVPPGLREVNFNLFGGTGDVDMRIKKGARPSEDDFDCKSTVIDSNNETCNFGAPTPGRYWIGLLGFVDYADVKLQVNGYAEY